MMYDQDFVYDEVLEVDERLYELKMCIRNVENDKMPLEERFVWLITRSQWSNDVTRTREDDQEGPQASHRARGSDITSSSSQLRQPDIGDHVRVFVDRLVSTAKR